MNTSPLHAWPPGQPARFLARPLAGDDLDIDFGMASRPALVSALLGACLRTADGRPVGCDAAWRWNVAERLQGLLALACASCGAGTTAVARCSHPGCCQQVELELAFDAFAGAPPAQVEWQADDGALVRCQLPTGQDQHDWQHSGAMDEQWLARRLVTAVDDAAPPAGWALPPAWVAPIAAALDGADPLTALAVAVTCPYCDGALDVDVDLEALLLDELRRSQRALLEQIHQLANAYHWSERDIAALPAWRRARYVARIGAQDL
jgi:hypothetical protein